VCLNFNITKIELM